MISCLIRNKGKPSPSYSRTDFYLPLLDGYYRDMKACDRVISLRDDIIFPWPWEASRYSTLRWIGKDVCRPWKFDDYNHRAVLFLPLNLCFVSGGNHSIAKGVVKGEGELIPEGMCDLRPIYSRVQLNSERGLYSCIGDDRFSSNGTQEFKIFDWEMAAIFELGRML